MKISPSGSGRVMAKQTSGVIRISLDLLVAEDASSKTCDLLVQQLVSRFSVTRASSVQDAGELIKSREFAVALVSLDLQPAPQAAARFADFALEHGVPVVLVTRSLRWLPSTSPHLRILPWVSPEASAADVDTALRDALAAAALLRREADGDRKSFGF